MIGKTISHYVILEKLGGGGMGVAYKARDTKLDRIVVLKFLPPHLLVDKESEQRFIAEAKVAPSFDHPNICTIHSPFKNFHDSNGIESYRCFCRNCNKAGSGFNSENYRKKT